MKTIKLNEENIYEGNLILINKNYPIRNQELENNKLVPIDIKYLNILMEFRAATALSHIIDDLKCKDEIILVSGYRPYREQETIYFNSLKEKGKKFTESYVALPGHSEHETGLAIDLAKNQENIDFICPEFPYEGIYNEFRERAPKYGFIERYEKGKENITGIAQEPWHFRYIGYPHSEIIYEEGLCLEEYIDMIKKYLWKEEHLTVKKGKQEITIFYLPIISTKEVVIHLPEHRLCQISGNNVDGCIVTLWNNIGE